MRTSLSKSSRLKTIHTGSYYKLRLLFLAILLNLAVLNAEAQINAQLDPSMPDQGAVLHDNSTPQKRSSSSSSLSTLALTQSFNLTSDSLALVDLYNATNGQQWTNKTNWLTGRLSTWAGVVISNSRVTRVQLQNNKLTGIIPESIGNLTALNLLYLNNNSLVGGIPSSIGNLTALTQLFLYDNPNLGGSIPAEIGNLVNLNYLYLYRDNLTGDIPSSLGNLTKILTLALHQNDLTGNLDWIGSLVNATQLWIYSNHHLRCPVPASIGNLTKLQQVYLHDNDFVGGLPAMGNLVNLTNFWIHFNYNLTGNVPAFISNWTKMQQLSIGDTGLSGPLPSNIGNMTALKELYIENSGIDGNLPTDLTRAVNLSIVDLKKLHMTTMPSFLTGFTKMSSVIVNNNDLTEILNFTTHVNKANLIYNVENNKLDFGDIEPHFTGVNTSPYKTFTYSPQADIGTDQTVTWAIASSQSLLMTTPGSRNNYQWQKLNASNTWLDISGEVSSQLQRPLVAFADSGRYRLKITNQWVTGLTLYSKTFKVNVSGYKVNWTDLSGVTDDNGLLKKAALDGGWNAGANSTNVLPAGQDGWLEFVADSSSMESNFMIGFGTKEGDFNVPSMEHGLYLNNNQNGQTLYVHESSWNGVNLGTWQVGDVFRVARVGSEMKYYRNGVEIRSVAIDPNRDLKVKTNINNGSSPKVTSSFDAHLNLQATLSPVNVNGTGGGIQITAINGTAPYSYQWSSGETTSSLTGKNTGAYTVTVTDGEGRTLTRTYHIGYKVLWTNLTGVTDSSGLLSKTALADGWNAGANSTNVLSANQDGWIQFVADERSVGSNYMIGFGTKESDFNVPTMEHGFYLNSSQNSQVLYAHESSWSGVTLGTWQVGDVFRIERTGSQIKYYRNGVEIRSVAVDPNRSLKIKTNIFNGSTPNVTSSFDGVITLQVTITPVNANGVGGGIQVKATGGKTPYTYMWVSGENISSISNKNIGSYSITVTDADGRSVTRSYHIGYNVPWKNLTGVSDNNGSLTKTAPDNWGNGGANSTNALDLNQDGWLEFVADSSSVGSNYIIGFSTNEGDFDVPAMGQGFYLNSSQNSQVLYVHESSWSGVSLGTWQVGDVFRIERVGSQIKYYRNGVEIRSVAVDPNRDLKIKTIVYNGTTPKLLSSFWLPAAEGQIPDDVEFSVLKTIYDSLGGPAWTNKTNWPTTWPATATAAEFGTWYGVHVSNGDVVSIDLHTNNLVGVIPSNIGNLTSMNELLLYENKLIGAIPQSIGNLTKLTNIGLFYNQLTSLPAQIGNLSALTSLRIEANQLSGSIPSEVGNLVNLTNLNLSSNLLTGNIPSSVGNLTKLVGLDLRHNQLSGVIPASIGSLASLTDLNVSENKLTGAVPTSIGSLTKLTSLGLYYNQFTSLPKEIGNLSALISLRVEANQLSDSIPSQIGNLVNLTNLNLSSNLLTGNIPSSLGNLTKLVALDLRHNQLSGVIPANIGSLVSLSDLNVSENKLTGAVPTSIGSLTKLTSLGLYYNQFTSLPKEIGNLSALISLRVEANQLSDSIPSQIGNLVNLTNLNLSSNLLRGSIPSSLGNLTKLVALDLRHNQLSGVIPASIGNLSSLVELYLSENKLVGAVPSSIGNLSKLSTLTLFNNPITSLPAELGNLTALTSMRAESCLIVNLPAGLKNITTLQTLNVLVNQISFADLEPFFTSPGVHSIPTFNYNPQAYIHDFTTISLAINNSLIIPARSLGQHSAITWQKQNTDGSWTNVTAQNEDVTGQTFKLTNGLPSIGSSYRWTMTNSWVTGLTLTSDPITVNGFAGVPDSLEFAALKALYLSTNGANWTNKTNWPTTWPATATAAEFGTWYGVYVVNGDVARIGLNENNLTGTIPTEIGNLSSLNAIYLSGNRLAGQIPPSIGNLSALTILQLYNNQLTTLPVEIGNLTELTDLELHSNQIAGTFPPSLGNLKKVLILNLQLNQMTGALPPEIGGLTSLQRLYLTGNKFTGSLPSQIGNLNSLLELRIRSTELSGPLPNEIGNLTNLQSLVMDQNQFSGSLPSTITNLSSLKTLDLSYNKLSGSLPQDIGRLTNLIDIELQSNQFTDSIPASIGDLNNLKYLSLSNNQLTGKVQSRLGNLANVLQLDVSSNKLVGSFPPELGNLHNVQILNLQLNQLTGSLPAEIGGLTGVQHLFLTGNNFTGSLPPQIGSLSSLQELRIRQTQLSGAIPQEIGNLSNLESLVMDQNQFTGSIPSSITNLSKLKGLVLSYNKLSGTLPAGMDHLSDLTDIELESNQITGQIPAEIGNLPKLSWFNISNNQISVLPSTLKNIPTISNLTVYGNKIGFADLENYFSAPGIPVVSTFGYAPQSIINDLSTVNLASNNNLVIPARGMGQHSIVTWEKQNTDGTWQNVNSQNEDLTGQTLKITNGSPTVGNFYRWTMTNSTVTGLTLNSAPIKVYGPTDSTLASEYHALMELYAATNGSGWKNNRGWKDANPNVVQSVQGWYGVAVDATGHVVHLDLDGIEDFTYVTNADGYQVYPGNNLVGTIPKSIGNLKSLGVLNLAGNKISGTIPNEVGQLSALSWLILSFNQLTGEIPSTIGNLSNLTYLYLESNLLTGDIPREVGNLSNLTAIQLMDNHLSGAIPKEFGNLKKIRYFHLYDNKFSGSMPSELGSITDLISLGLHNNELTGQIPQEIGNLQNLGALFVGGNQLTGSVPASLASLTKLEQLYLDSCRLSDTIPAAIGSLPRLKYVGISNNKFTFSDLLPLRQQLVNNSNFGLKGAKTLYNFTFDNSYSPFLHDGTITLSLDSGRLKAGGASQWNNAFIKLITVIGHKYSVAFDVDVNGGGKMSAFASDHTYNLNQLTITSNGSYNYQFTATTNETLVLFANDVAGPRDFYLDNVVIKDLNAEIATLPANRVAFLINQPPNALGIVQKFPEIPVFDNIAQDSIDAETKLTAYAGSPITLTAKVDRNTNPTSLYQWFRDNMTLTNPSVNGYMYTIPGITQSDSGKYYYKITNTGAPELTLTSRGQTLNVDVLGLPIQWIDLTGVTNNSGFLTKTATDGWNAGANSSNLIKANQDGYIAFVANDSTSSYMIGFTSNSGSFNTTGMDYGLAIQPSQNLSAWENSTTGTDLNLNWTSGDVLKVARIGNKIIYYKNGTEIRSDSTDSAKELRTKILMYKGSSPVINTSFDIQLAVQSVVTPVKGTGTGGAISSTVPVGTAPYTYLWSSGETTSTISNKSIGTYSVTVRDANARTVTYPYAIGYDAAWTDLHGATANSPLTKVLGGDGWNAGGNSWNILEANQDGWLQFVVNSNTNNYIIGFSSQVEVFSETSIDYGLSIQSGQMLQAWESSASGVSTSTSWQTGDVIKIERIGSQIKYYRNGVEIRSVSTDPNKEFKVKAVIYNMSGQSPSVITSFDIRLAIQPNFTPLQSFGVTGNISIFSLNGKAPFYYKWSTGETSAAITNKPLGTYSVKVTDTESRTVTIPYGLGYQTSWTDLSGVTQSGNALLRSSGDGWTSGANSNNILKANEDGWVEFIIDNATNNFMVGLATKSDIFNQAAIDYGVLIQPDRVLSAWENSWSGINLDNWRVGDAIRIARVGDQIKYYLNGVELRSVTTDPAKELQIKALVNAGQISLVQTSIQLKQHSYAPIDDATVAYKIPSEVKVSRDGRLPLQAVEQQFTLSSINQGDTKNVFPGCIDGKYYTGFQLYYDLGDKKTTEDWSAYVQVTVFHGDDSLWTSPIRVNMTNQTFIATAFYDKLITCDGTYNFRVDFKTITGEAPQDNIYLKVLHYKHRDEIFNPIASMSLNCNNSGSNETMLSWNFTGKGAIEYDIEWVFIEEHENFTGTGLADPFIFKEPVRITTSASYYKHQVYYPNGKLWYRARAVGYNPEFPTHRIPGNWFYAGCNPIAVTNHQPDMNWQEQTVFAEEGKYKKVMNYFDGSLRQRQAQTNLSTEKVTLVGETLYDFEGRASVNILAVPAMDANLIFKPNFNTFANATDPIVASNTSQVHQKFNYDNRNAENSVLSNTSGAGQYYSPTNGSNSIHKDYIPDSKGYAYSQSEFTNDGTGRVKRQSGVGEEFRMDGTHAVRYVYGTAAQEELTRLFGSNVGNASHYKKNLVVDANGQVSVSYLDQEGKVIATALAGASPTNVEPLSSYGSTPITINLNSKNQKVDGVSSISHKITNVSTNTPYTFKYDLTAYASAFQQIGCKSCSFDLKISITDTDGKLIDLKMEDGNESMGTPDSLSYVRKNISAEDCANPRVVKDIMFEVVFGEIGDYTITKTLVGHELSFEKMDTLVRQKTSVQTMITQINNSHVVDPANCDICFSCPEAEQAVDDAVNEIATEDCDNLYRQIEQYYQHRYDSVYSAQHDGEVSEDVYVVPQDSIQKHPLYCKYQLCVKNKASDIFEKQLVRAVDWEAAVSKGYDSLAYADKDPFFNDANLSGYSRKSDMLDKLNNTYLATINGVEYSGPLLEVTDPANTNFYIDDAGNHDINGKHILYFDLMSQKNTMAPADYQTKLTQQRWAAFRGIYTEDKRKIKLDIPEYKNCAKAVEELQQTDKMPKTSEEMKPWAEANYTSGSASPSDLMVGVSNMEFKCRKKFEKSDSSAIAKHLGYYFSAHPDNFFKLILQEDFAKQDTSLLEIQKILNNSYSCGLDSIALVDPLSCAHERIVVIDPGFDTDPLPTERQASTFTGFATESIQSTDKSVAESEANGAVAETQQTIITPETLDQQQMEQAKSDKAAADLQALRNSFSQKGGSGKRLAAASTLSVDPAPSPEEYQALRDLYHATRTDGDKWANETGWFGATEDPNAAVSVKNWYGVYVDTNGHVIALSLDNNSLNGTLPSTLGGLKYLQRISLNGPYYYNQPNPNTISGAVPTSIGSLNQLTYMSINHNQLTSLPASINNLSQLQSIDVSFNQIGGMFLNVSNMKALTDLDLAYNGITDISSLTVLTQIQTLDLSGNPLGTLPDSFVNLTKLTYLSLNNCSLTKLPTDFGKNWTSLTSLGLSFNPLSALTDYFRGQDGTSNAMNSLQTLAITSNYNLQVLPDNFGKNLSSLQTLYLYDNGLKTLTGYFNGLPNGMTGLKSLYISYNSNGSVYGSNPLTSLPANFGQNWTSLTMLQMEGTQLTSLTDSFHGLNSDGEGMSNLQTLYLGQNRLLTSLPAHFGQSMTKLTELHLEFDAFSSLPDYFHGLTSDGDGMNNLQKLYLNNNRSLTSLPEHFGQNLTKLAYLYIQSDGLSTLPDYFHGPNASGEGMTSLQYLYAYDNGLTSLPDHFGENLTKLIYLDLHTNQLTTLPDYFHGATASGDGMNSLQTLYLYDNKLTSLPDHFGDNWTSLNYLRLDKNFLTQLPDYFHGTNASGNGMNNLVQLYLGNTNGDGNQLSSLPTHFGENLIKLTDLHIENNKLTSLSDYFRGANATGNGMNGLLRLYAYNNLLPSLPSNFGENWTSLNYLSLYKNNLTSLSSYFRGSDPTLGNGMNNLATLYLGNAFKSYTVYYNSYYRRYDVSNYSTNLGSNLLTQLPANFGKNWTGIIELHLEGNQLTTLPDYFRGANTTGGAMNRLAKLYLNNNKLTSLPDHFGENWTSLSFLSLYENNLTSLPDYFRGHNTQGDGMNNLQTLYLGNAYGVTNYIGNQLKQLPDHFAENWTQMVELHLEGNKLQTLPDYFQGNYGTGTGMDKLTKLFMHTNVLTQLPANFGKNLNALDQLSFYDNKVTNFDTPLEYMTNLKWLNISHNELINFPLNLGNLTKIQYVDANVNQMSYKVPNNLSATLIYLNISGNKFTFSDFLEAQRNFKSYTIPYQFSYAPQQKVDIVKTIPGTTFAPVMLSVPFDRDIQQDLGPTYKECTFQWFKLSSNGTPSPINSESVSGHTFTFTPKDTDNGNRYQYTIRNADATNLLLTSNIQTLILRQPKTDTICVAYDENNPTVKMFEFDVDWNQEIQKCMDNAAAENEILTNYAIDKMVEDSISTLYNQYRTRCLESVKENLTYSYQSNEHHYTLYYFDQAKNLVQTVPPQGVNLSTQGHTLVTRYQYNSVNQLMNQVTPDAGKSQFWYNDKGQLKLSQNAQQAKDNNYSYTKYDEQARIVEVGEMNTTAVLDTLLAHIEEMSFPEQSAYALSDITRTHYDFVKPGLKVLDQENLRGRVSYVEVLEKNATDTLATYYTYDVHGNVKSLMQQVPGLPYKRTDYVYDLISNKVNYVMYQYDKSDEFIHRYTYDSDNRIRDVYTSNDGFIWDKDASYFYYQHGPLARVELGEYRVQGLDYYYTLQGWMKGVNGMVDPGADGSKGSLVPKDEMNFNLGYYQNDYKGVGLGAVSDYYQQPMQRYMELMGNSGLFNGNISWMSTDLKKIGQIKHNRNKGMQGMVYQYDQLNRIMQSRSLTQFDPNTGFASRTTEPGAYDEDYSYDANGNLLTLQRRNEVGGMQDNFNYAYYKGTNKLRQLVPVERDTTYAGGQVISNHKVYRNITITGNSYVPSGADITIKATDNIEVDPNFDVDQNTKFHAYVLPEDEGMYLYDATGNLIWDQEEGVKISWTLYGKVRDVIIKDSITVSYRYDALGNRIEKKVITPKKTSITRYLRDASNNVMAIYKDSTITEAPIYGSSRLGMYTTGRRIGHRTLGPKNYEMSNHLSNVLAVISDNIYMNSDSAWTKVVSAHDYYPFGLEMKERNYSDTTYRYGFNGKEKDNFSDVVYDYGMRIYNPRIAKFLSIDPLKGDTPDLSPFGYAQQSPISHIDVGGKYALFIHFMLTKFKLKSLGVGDVAANLIAHYASIYSDNPGGIGKTSDGPGFISRMIVEKNVSDSKGDNPIFNEIGGRLSDQDANNIRYDPEIDYSRTIKSQTEDDEAQMWHGTRSYAQRNAVSAELAVNWSLMMAWENLYKSAEEGHMLSFDKNSKGIELLGLSLHAFQDTQAHQGAIFRATLLNGGGLFSWDGNQHDLGNDSNPAVSGFRKAAFMTESAIIIHQVLTGDNSNLYDGQKLFTEGMLEHRRNKLNDSFTKAGFSSSTNDDGTITLTRIKK